MAPPRPPRRTRSSSGDASGNFAAGTISANLSGNASTATSATSFTGNLAGDVTGTQGATTVGRLQNRSVANTAPNDGDVLKYSQSASQWQPSPETNAANFVFLTASSAQVLPPGNTANVAFDTVVQVDGWILTPPGESLVCTQAGLYLGQYDAHAVTVDAGTNDIVVFQALVNGASVPGSGAAVYITNLGQQVSKSFMTRCLPGEPLEVTVSAQSQTDALLPVLGSSASITITRVQ
jgi:hypothetical protein